MPYCSERYWILTLELYTLFYFLCQMQSLESVKEPTPPKPVEAEATVTVPTHNAPPKPPRAKKGISTVSTVMNVTYFLS